MPKMTRRSASLAMALLLLAGPVLAGAADSSDAFDGFSRTYSYVYSRPWHYLWFTVVASAYGSVVIVFIISFAGLSVFLASRSVASRVERPYRSLSDTATIHVRTAG